MEPRLLLAYGLILLLIAGAGAAVFFVRHNSWSRRYNRQKRADQVEAFSPD